MFKNYLVIAWRNIIKKPLFSAINILGLAIGLASCILILLFVDSETGYDSWIPDSERVVRLHTAYTMSGRTPLMTVRSAGKMMPALKDYLRNEVEAGVRLVSWGTTVRKDGQGFDEQVLFADQDFFNVMTLPLIHGQSETSFNKPNDLLVTEETAIRYFGRTDVVGETLTLCCLEEQAMDLVVTGVLRDLPENSHLDIKMLVYMDLALFGSFSGLLDTWTSLNVYTYFKLKPDMTIEQTQQRINYWMDNESPFQKQIEESAGGKSDRKASNEIHQKLMALEDLHLKARQDAGTMGDMTPLGDHRMVVTFSLIALLILVIACINFMNLSTARSGQRASEVAMRKVLGATRSQVAVQFLVEAVGLVLVSMLLALVIVELVLPMYNQVLNKTIVLDLAAQPQLVLGLVVLTLVVGIGAGSYPALVLSRYRPGQILKTGKNQDAGGSAALRNGLVVFQFAISIGLLVCTSVVYLQTLHASQLDLGFSQDSKMVLGITAVGDRVDSLKQQLEAIPEVSSVVYSSEVPSQDHENNTFFTRPGEGQREPQRELLNYHHMGFDFFEAYEVETVAGRLFDRQYGSDAVQIPEDGELGYGGVILNQSAVSRLGYDNAQHAVGTTLSGEYQDARYQFTIVGVVPDLYFRSIKFDIRPSIYLLNPQRFRLATIAYQGDLNVVQRQVEAVWEKVVPMEPVHINQLDDMIQRQYRQENIQMRLFSVFSVLAIIVACLGLYGLAAFSAERRTREIGIRKVMGASVKDIVMLLVWQFTRPVMYANLLAWPVAVWLMLNWLQQFPYRIDSLWILVVCAMASVASVVIAWLTVGGNAARVARANPIRALRHE